MVQINTEKLSRLGNLATMVHGFFDKGETLVSFSFEEHKHEYILVFSKDVITYMNAL